MDDKIALFDRYVDGGMTESESRSFESRLHSDAKFLADFRIYLFILKGICDEVEQDDIEFGIAMKRISAENLDRVIGRRAATPGRGRFAGLMRRRFVRIASVAAVLVVGIFAALHIRQLEMNRIDNIIVEYNYVPEYVRGVQQPPAFDIPSLEKAYRSAPDDDVQAQQDAGMRLALAYLKEHDRKKARQMLTELSERFDDDEIFVSRCRTILSQLE